MEEKYHIFLSAVLICHPTLGNFMHTSIPFAAQENRGNTLLLATEFSEKHNPAFS